ncbi:MAG: SlyX family protein [Myxococcota bacterium]
MSEERLTELELRSMAQESLLEELNEQVRRAYEQVDQAERRIERLETALEGLIRELGIPPNERPPHY